MWDLRFSRPSEISNEIKGFKALRISNFEIRSINLKISDQSIKQSNNLETSMINRSDEVKTDLSF